MDAMTLASEIMNQGLFVLEGTVTFEMQIMDIPHITCNMDIHNIPKQKLST